MRKDITITPTIEEPLRTVNGDEITLAEALVNILSNAVKFSRPSSEVSIKAVEKEGQIVIAITDTGIGISKEDLPFIFNDFYSGKSTPVAEKSGGIGLAITKRIIEAHDGTISVKSELGKGSTFTICLPVSTTQQT
jgi:signal transduction histidine kinase